jgi:hypothetical protein
VPVVHSSLVPPELSPPALSVPPLLEPVPAALEAPPLLAVVPPPDDFPAPLVGGSSSSSPELAASLRPDGALFLPALAAVPSSLTVNFSPLQAAAVMLITNNQAPT